MSTNTSSVLASSSGDTLNIICDLLDPSQGSEFLVGFSSIAALTSAPQSHIIIWVPARGDNVSKIYSFLEELLPSKVVIIREFPFLFSLDGINHSNKLFFVLDLLVFYLRCRNRIPKGSYVWKCSQPNVLFCILSLSIIPISVCGPISGLMPTQYKSIPARSLSIRIYYFAYDFMLNLFKAVLCHIMKSRPTVLFIFASEVDRAWLPKTLKSRTLVLNETAILTLSHRNHIYCSGQYLQTPYEDIAPTNKNRIKILWSGALIPRKNPFLLLHIIDSIPTDRLKDISFTCIGDGFLKKEFYKHVYTKKGLRPEIDIEVYSSFARAKFLGILPTFDILLITSLREISSFLAIEAIFNNVSIVAPEIGCFNEFLAEDHYLYGFSSSQTPIRAAAALLAAVDRCVLWQQNGQQFDASYKYREMVLCQYNRLIEAIHRKFRTPAMIDCVLS